MSVLPTGQAVNMAPVQNPAEFLCAPPYLASLMLPNRPECVRPAVEFLLQTARALQVAEASKPLFEVALTEALTNAVKHGHGSDEGAMIVCEVERSARQLAFRIIDTGPGFVVPDPRLPNIRPDEVNTIPESGYGLPIIQHVFPVVRATRVNGRFGLELCLPLS